MDLDLDLDFTPSDATSSLQQDVDILRQELMSLEAKRDALLKQIEQEEQGMIDDAAALNPQKLETVDRNQQVMHDILMAYRLTGITIFDAEEMEESDWSKYNMENFPSRPKEMGIRFETFANGKVYLFLEEIHVAIKIFNTRTSFSISITASYHEPYYVMVRKRTGSPDDGDAEEQEGDTSQGTLYITKHTIPHWIPLRDIEKRYLNRDLSTFTRLISERLQEIPRDNPPPPAPVQVD
ncbi:hypothetical protein BGX34_001750 [Mortierella sp. NVP85]|nr:hypothetical protein BGX34_001750 [Mortierella sp. NVP85]